MKPYVDYDPCEEGYIPESLAIGQVWSYPDHPPQTMHSCCYDDTIDMYRWLNECGDTLCKRSEKSKYETPCTVATYLGTAYETQEELKQKPEKEDLVGNPNHYNLFPEHNLQVKHIVQRAMDNADYSFDWSSNEAGWIQQSLQYLLRFYGKNGWEDIKKAREALDIAIKSAEERGAV